MYRIRRVLIIMFMAASFAVPAMAGDFEKGMEAYERDDYAAALAEWKPLAEQGFAGAQFGLGVMYANGLGVPQDYAEAVRWYRMPPNRGMQRRRPVSG